MEFALPAAFTLIEPEGANVMLLEKLEQNRHALMQIGQKAVRRGRELGLTPSCTDLNGRDEKEFEDRADVDDDVPPAEVMKR